VCPFETNNKRLNDWLMDRAGHPAGCLFAAVALLCGLFQKRRLLRWVNFKTIINQEKPSNQRLCIAKTETIENSAGYSHRASRHQTGHETAQRGPGVRLQGRRWAPSLVCDPMQGIAPHPAKATPRTTRMAPTPSASTPRRSKV
jgi:hypothetical protein